MTDFPSWLTAPESAAPKRGRAAFPEKSTRSLMKVMAHFRQNQRSTETKETNSALRLFGLLVLIVLTALSHNFGFVLFMLAFVAVRTAFLRGNEIRLLLRTLLPALLLSFLILLPSFFLGNTKSLFVLLSKILVSVSLVMLLSLLTPWSEITRALKTFRVPDIVIFTFDLAIKYIALLGTVCSEMLTALKIRTVGKMQDGRKAAGGILATVFLRAKRAADDTQQAMECRGFSGEYVLTERKAMFGAADRLYLLFLLGAVGLFTYLEVVL